MLTQKNSSLLLISLSCIALSACGTTDKSLSESNSAKISQAMADARMASQGRVNRNTSIDILENRYKRDPLNATNALNYAAALREEDYLNRASLVLAPFAHDNDSSIATKLEFVAIQLALGNYSIAEEFAQKAIIEDETNAQAFHYLGIALEAQSLHEKAERAFRKGLDHWEGDPTPIMNNLALNLATQGFTDESLEILEKARIISPDRDDIERNYRIISALKETNAPTRDPVEERVIPKKKPERS